MYRKVLLVDFESILSITLKAFLEAAGHEVTIAEDDNTALGLIQADLPDAILYDLHFPDVGGLEFCRKVRDRPEWTEIYLVVLTSAPQDPDVQQATEIGVQLLLPKPFPPEKLLNALQNGQSDQSLSP